MALTNKLSNIATAIREKTGTTELMTLDEMPEKIAGIQGGGSGGGSGECTKHHIPDEALVISGDCNYRFANGGLDWLIKECGSEITTKDITDARNMFKNNNLSEIPFDINLKSGSNVEMTNAFSSSKLTKLPYIKGKISSLSYFLYDCNSLKEIQEDWANYIDWSYIHTNKYANIGNTFDTCRSLRRIPDSLLSSLWGIQTSSSYLPYSNQFNNCFVLDEINNLAIQQSTITSNRFVNNIAYCERLKDYTFAVQEDGAPYTSNWKSQVIDFSSCTGWAARDVNITAYSAYHGITTATKVTDDASYQALKDNPDWWTTDVAYSRYNHDSAVRTINSLPDTSAYLATAGGINTIKFKGASGSATDEGQISALTPEEISIAAAKGWTVTLV